MSYFRGPLYVWSDGTHVHLWSAAGYDSWDESVWAEEYARKNSESADIWPLPSGIQIAQEQMDAYVIMRFAELVETGKVTQMIAHALTESGNVGAYALATKATAIAAAFPSIAAGPT